MILIIILYLVYEYDFFTQKGNEYNIKTILYNYIFDIYSSAQKKIEKNDLSQIYLEDYLNKVK